MSTLSLSGKHTYSFCLVKEVHVVTTGSGKPETTRTAIMSHVLIVVERYTVRVPYISSHQGSEKVTRWRFQNDK